MSPTEEHWAEALAVVAHHGDRSHVHIAKRIAALAVAGDATGVERWREIAARLDQLMRPSAET